MSVFLTAENIFVSCNYTVAQFPFSYTVMTAFVMTFMLLSGPLALDL